MPPSLQLWNAARSAQIVAPIVTGAIEAGTTFGPTDYWLYNDFGALLANTSLATLLRIETVVNDGTSYRTSGYPILDQRWIQIAVAGTDNTGDSTMQNQTTGFIPVGAGAPL